MFSTFFSANTCGLVFTLILVIHPSIKKNIRERIRVVIHSFSVLSNPDPAKVGTVLVRVGWCVGQRKATIR